MTHCYASAAPPHRRADIEAIEEIDSLVCAIAEDLQGEERQYPVLISTRLLSKAEYPQAFPHLLMAATRSHPEARHSPGAAEPQHPQWYLSPAVCYHVYAEHSGSATCDATVITARGRCFRSECETEPGVRQIEFEMREIVLIGAREWVEATAERARDAVNRLAADHWLTGTWSVAEDPFFLPAAAGKAVMQRLLKVKHEFQWPAAGGLALASVNRHGTFFGTRFEISTSNDEPAHTACIAVGLDRWLHARQIVRGHATEAGSRDRPSQEVQS